jgi:hypothetical protein
MKRDASLEGDTATIYSDTRLGGVKRWTLGNPDNANMRVPEQTLDSVGFLCTRRQGGGLDYIGNAFFIETSEECGEEAGYHYLVTAKHVVDEGQVRGGLLLRLNTTDGGVDTMRLSGEWEFPDEDVKEWNTDLAVMRFIPSRDDFVYYAIPSYGVIRRDRLPRELMHRPIGIGEELLVAGLFHATYGSKRNRPIVRFCNIAAMPDEPLKDEKTKKKYFAYLADMRSIGGLSGAPVFLLVEVFEEGVKRSFDPYYFLLGVMRGHWHDDIDSILIRRALQGKVEINLGIAAVTPSQEIISIMNGEKMKKERQKEEAERPSKYKSSLDANVSKPKGIGGEITSEGFHDALKNASQKICSPDEEKNET